jgi:hypothetical protein
MKAIATQCHDKQVSMATNKCATVEELLDEEASVLFVPGLYGGWQSVCNSRTLGRPYLPTTSEPTVISVIFTEHVIQ